MQNNIFYEYDKYQYYLNKMHPADNLSSKYSKNHLQYTNMQNNILYKYDKYRYYLQKMHQPDNLSLNYSKYHL